MFMSSSPGSQTEFLNEDAILMPYLALERARRRRGNGRLGALTYSREWQRVPLEERPCTDL